MKLEITVDMAWQVDTDRLTGLHRNFKKAYERHKKILS
jgi:hypothetical protein